MCIHFFGHGVGDHLGIYVYCLCPLALWRMLIFTGAPLVLFVPGEPAIRLWLRLIATLDDDDE